MMGLRLAEGVDVAALATRLGFATGDLVDTERLALYQRLGLAWARDGWVGATLEGMPVLNTLIAELVPQGLMERSGVERPE